MGCCETLQLDTEKKNSIHTKTDSHLNLLNPSPPLSSNPNLTHIKGNSINQESLNSLKLPDMSCSSSLISWKEFSGKNI